MKRLYAVYQNNRQAPVALLDQALVSGGNFVTGVLLARSLGLNHYGVFAMAWLVVLFFSSIQQALIIAPLQTLAPKKAAGERQDFLSALFGIQLLTGLLFAVLTFAVCQLPATALLDQVRLESLSIVLPVTVFTFLLSDFFRKLFFLNQRPMDAFALDIITYGLQVAGLVTAASFDALDLRRSMIILASAGSFSCAYGFFRSGLEAPGMRYALSVLREMWDYSRWLIGTSFLQWCSGNFFIVTAGGILGPVAVGAVRMAQNVVGVLNILFLAMENFIPSNASRIYHNQGLMRLYLYMRQVMLVAGAATLVALAAIALFSREIVAYLYGSGYAAYDYVLPGFAVVYIFVFTGLPIRYFIRTVEKNRDIFFSYVLSAGASLLLAAPMISRFGIAGVMIGLVLTQIIVQVWLLHSLQPEIRTLWKSST